MEIEVNVKYKSIKKWEDSIKRVEHIVDRMQLRGMFESQIEEAVQKGAKRLREDGSLIAEYRWFKVIYRQFQLENVRKIYPITVMEA